MPAATDREIIEMAAAGDMDAFRLLVERHQSFVYGVARRIVGRDSDAEDIAQETFVKLWKNLGKYRSESKLTTWMYKIVANLSYDYLKSSYGRHQKYSEPLEGEKPHASVEPADQQMMDREFHEAVVRMTEDLSPKQRAVFVLRDVEGLSVKEISEMLSMSAGMIKSNLHRGRKRIAELISSFYQQRKTR